MLCVLIIDKEIVAERLHVDIVAVRAHQLIMRGLPISLTRERIIAEAIELIDESGLENLTTRKLASRLGVKSPALYWHFSSKRSLADAVASAMLAPEAWPGPETPGLTPETWLAARARAFRKALLAHRDGAAIHAGTTPDEALLPGLRRQVTALVAHGLSSEDALRTLLAISRYTVGWVLEEQALAQRHDAGLAAAAPASSPERAPAICHRPDRDVDFEFGLQALIVGSMSHRRNAPP